MQLRSLWRHGAYLASFVAGRGALFGAPLLIANLLARADYGAIETAQAAASLVASTATLGTASVVPLVLLGHTPRASMAGITLQHLGLVAACLLVAAIAAVAGAEAAVPLAALFAAAVALQGLASTHLKTLGRGDASVLLDAGLFGLMALAATAAHLAHATRPLAWVVAGVLAYALALAAVYARRFHREATPAPEVRWRGTLLMGIPLMVGGIVSLLVTTSGRLGMGLLAGPVVTADYAVLARAAALPIVAHQLLLIARFRNLFTLEPAAVERAAARIVALVAGSALGFLLLCPLLGRLLGPAFVAAWAAHRVPAGLIVAQSVLWSAIALNDLMISRHQVMPRILPGTAGYTVLALGAGWFTLHLVGPTLAHFVAVHSVVMLGFYVVQSIAMRANAIAMTRVWAMAVLTYLGLVGLALAALG